MYDIVQQINPSAIVLSVAGLVFTLKAWRLSVTAARVPFSDHQCRVSTVYFLLASGFLLAAVILAETGWQMGGRT